MGSGELSEARPAGRSCRVGRELPVSCSRQDRVYVASHNDYVASHNMKYVVGLEVTQLAERLGWRANQPLFRRVFSAEAIAPAGKLARSKDARAQTWQCGSSLSSLPIRRRSFAAMPRGQSSSKRSAQAEYVHSRWPSTRLPINQPPRVSDNRSPCPAGLSWCARLAGWEYRSCLRNRGLSRGRMRGPDAVPARQFVVDQSSFSDRSLSRIREGGAFTSEPISSFHGTTFKKEREQARTPPSQDA